MSQTQPTNGASEMKQVRIESAGMEGWQVKVYANLQVTRPQSVSRVYATRKEAEAAAEAKENE